MSHTILSTAAWKQGLIYTRHNVMSNSCHTSCHTVSCYQVIIVCCLMWRCVFIAWVLLLTLHSVQSHNGTRPSLCVTYDCVVVLCGRQVDKELATGEYFLKENERRQKKRQLKLVRLFGDWFCWLRSRLIHCITLQCESEKNPPTTCSNFSKTVGNFSTKFYMPIMRSYLR